MTRDNMPEGDTGASGVARAMGRADDAPGPLRIQVAAHVASNIEGVVGRVDDADAPGGAGHLWKLVRTFDDPGAWTEPGVRQLASDGIGGPQWRTRVLPDEWELYDLDADPVEARNRADDPDAAAVFALLQERMKAERHRSVPERNRPWPYVKSAMTAVTGVPLLPPRELIVQGVRQQAQQRIARRRAQRGGEAPPPAKLVRRGLQRLGLHPDDPRTVAWRRHRSPGPGGRHQPRAARPRKADRRVRQRTDRAVLRIPRCRR